MTEMITGTWQNQTLLLEELAKVLQESVQNSHSPMEAAELLVTELRARPELTIDLFAHPEEFLVGPNGELITIEEITPEIAADWLGLNTHNRNVKQKALAKFVRDMESGNWQFTGDSVKFAALTGEEKFEVHPDQDTLIIDGQHRLLAQVEAKVTLPMLVIRDLPVSAQEVIDQGTQRRASDVLTLQGEANGPKLGATIRLCWQWEQGDFHANLTPSPHEYGEYLYDNPSIRHAVALGYANYEASKMQPSQFSALFYQCWKVDPEAAEMFFIHHLGKGYGLDDDHPAAALRVRMKDYKNMNPAEVYAYTIYAWLLWRAQRPMTKIQAPKGGWKTGAHGNMPRPDDRLH